MSLDGVIFPVASTAELARIRPNYAVMLGDTTDEFAFSMNEVVKNNITTVNDATLDKYLQENSQLALVKRVILEFYDPHRTLTGDNHFAWTKLISRAITDSSYFAPARTELQWSKNNNNSNVFLYDFEYFNSFCANSYAIDDWTPSVHCSELCFLWFYHYEWERAAAEGRVKQTDLQVADNLGRAWTNFAKYGNPGWTPMRDRFEFVVIGDTVSGVRKDWGHLGQELFNEIVPSLLKTDLHPFHIDPRMKKQIEQQAPSILNSWLAATCPTWKPLETTTLTVFPLKSEMTTVPPRHRNHTSQPDSSSLPSLSFSILIVIATLYL